MTDLGPADFRRLEETIKDLTKELRSLPANMALLYVRQDVHSRDLQIRDERIQGVDDDLGTERTRINKHDNYFRWIVQTVIGAIVLAGIAALLVQGGSFK